MSKWTVAFRNPRANRFLRYSGMSVEWQAAVDYARELTAARPDLQVWYTTTAEYDRTHPNEDSNNILVESGRRVRVFETDSLPDKAPALA
jgi:hypothetical protein